MTKYFLKFGLLMIIALCTSCVQKRSEGEKIIVKSQNTTTNHGPNRITRNIIQDKKGNIWMAAFDGVSKYDGKSFTNVTGKSIPARFFSILEDSKGNFWFGSVGAGVYRYDWKSFEKFTIAEGLIDNGAGVIFEDKKGNIWFGGARGVSRYDGNIFKNFILDGNKMYKDTMGKTPAKKHLYGVTSIIEDRNGWLWFGAGGVFRYDGISFTPFTHNDKPFKNVRSIIEDKNGNVWIGGADGLWRYDGNNITNITTKFVGHIMEDKKGNIWTSSESAHDPGKMLLGYNNNSTAWALSRYDAKSLTDKKPTVTEITHKTMVFGILEDDKGNIWFGDFDGVHRYGGKIITDFKTRVARSKISE